MLTFKEFLTEQKELLAEKLIVFRGKRQKFGRIIFLAGGAGSGKGFAMKNFMDVSTSTDKVRDVDEWKKAFLKISDLKNKYPELRNLDLRNPKDVFTLHKFVSEKGIKSKTLDALLTDLDSRRLPNIVFDVTLKDMNDVEDVLPKLLGLGYDPKDVHLVWVLTNFHVAVSRNKDRDRVVPDDILLKTHEGAAKTMFSILKGNLPKGLDGEIHVILNNKENTVFFKDKDGNNIKVTPKFGEDKGKEKLVVKDFLSMKAKEAGKKIEKGAMSEKLLGWIRDNIPKSRNLKDFFSADGEISIE